MTQQYDNMNKGTLFKNDKNGNEKWADLRGSINIEGVEFWISGWYKVSGPNAKTPGEKFVSLSVQRKQPRPDAAPTPHQQAKQDGFAPPVGAFDNFEDDIPL